MLKRKNRKGFTLAELLIVVAIIAVLVAIAVPLFVGSLSKAKEATKNANIRAARGTAVVYLLEHNGKEEKGTDGELLWPTTIAGWEVEATVTSSGEISITVLKAYASTTTYTDDATESDGTWTVKLNLKKTDVTIPQKTSVPGGAG